MPGHRTRPACSARARQAKTVAVRLLELEAVHGTPVDGPEAGPQALWVAQCVSNWQAHVWLGELGHGGSVDELHHGVYDRLGVNYDRDAVIIDVEQLVGLDDLESLVHERRRVDGDLGPHGPGGVGQGVLDADPGELRRAAAPEGAPASGEHQAGDLGGARPRPQALVKGAVLGVDRHDLRPRGVPGAGHHRPTGDERFLVGERQATPALEGGHGHGQAREPHHGVEHHVTEASHLGQGRLGPAQHLGPRWHRRRQRRRQGDVADGDHVGMQLGRLRGEGVHRAPRRQGRDAKALGLSAHDVDSLHADRPRRTDEAHGQPVVAVFGSPRRLPPSGARRHPRLSTRTR